MKFIILLLLGLLPGTAFAQSSARFTITRSVVAGGGETFSTSSRFQLGSTIAQPLAAVPSSSRFSIQGGFWIWPAQSFSPPPKSVTISSCRFKLNREKLTRCNTLIPFPHRIGRFAERCRRRDGENCDEFCGK